MKTLQNAAAYLFVACLFILTVVAVLGVWEFFAHDVITKSFETLGVIALVSVIVIVAGRFMDAPAQTIPDNSLHMFRAIRYMTLTTLIVSVALLALVGILSIWNVITDPAVVHKALSSIAIVAFSSYLAVAVCLERENHPLWQKRSSEVSVGGLAALGIFFWIAVLTGIFG